MRCSLLALSSYLDGELPPDRATELEAHLVGCARCSTALGYLREEAQRIAGLTRVHIEEPAIREMFALVGLTAEEEIHEPARLSPSIWQSEPMQQPEPPPVLRESDNGRGLPWTPRPASLSVDYEPSAPAGEEEEGIESEVEQPSLFEPVAETQAEEPAVEPEPPIFEPSPVPEPPPIEIPSAIQEPSIDEPSIAEPLPPPVPAMAEAGGASRILNRVRDAIAVRWALMRGGGEPDLDDSVQIVSGAGASSWQGRPVHRAYLDRMERRQSRADAAVTAAGPIGETLREENEREAIGRVMPRVPSVTPEFEPTPVHASVAAGNAPPHPAETTYVPQHAEPIAQSDVQPTAQEQRLDEDAPQPYAPGRHMRTVTRGGSNGSRWSSFGQLSTAVARRTGAQHGPAGVAGVDRRVWIFGAAVLVLMVIGVLVGKATSPLPSATVTQPTAAPSLAPRASATAAPTAAPTVAPTPAPPPAGPQNLTDQVTLGTGATGFTVDSIRYSAHGPAGGYRLVFDISGPAGSPNALMGFGDPTTFYVEFAGATSSGAPAAPAPGVVTGVKVLPASAVPGKTVYAFSLTRNLNFVANYLAGPRLVIDLK